MGIDMRCFKLLLYIGLIFTTSANFCANLDNSSITTVAYVSPGNILPIHYNIHLRIPYFEKGISFYGYSNINFTISCATRNIGLYSLGMIINENATKLQFEKDISNYRPSYYSYDTEKHIVVITFDNELIPGFYTLYVKFVGITPRLYEYELFNFFRQSYRNKEGNSVLIARMPFMPVAINAKDFLCWDQPMMKTTFTLAVKHHPKYRVLSYTIPRRVRFMKQDGMVWLQFSKSPPMSTCAMTVVVLDLDRISNSKRTVNIWCRPYLKSHLKFARYVATNIMRNLYQHLDYLKHSNTISKIDHVAIPKFVLLDSAYWGINIYNEQDILYNNETDPTFRMMDVAKKIAYEVVHQWFGVVNSPSCWSNIWISEGFTLFFHTYILDKMFKQWRLMHFLVVKNLQESLHANSIGPSDFNLTIHNPYNYYFNSISHNKASIILRMLQHIMTDAVFWKGTNLYLNYHILTPISFDKLSFTMQLAMNTSQVFHKNFKIKEVMDSWINHEQYPLVTVTRNYETGETRISQKTFLLGKYKKNYVTDNHKWWIPITFATQTYPDFSNTFSNYWLSPLDQDIILQIYPYDWIIVNLQQVGYYRVNYDSTNWKKIANYLNSKKYTKVHVLNRAQIIDDAYVLLMEKQLDIFTFLNLTRYLSQETNYVAWYPMFRILSLLMRFFSFPESIAFKLHMAKIFTGLLKNVGYEEKHDENDLMKLKRLNTVKWACIVGNSECRKMATNKLNKYLADPAYKISQWWQEWIYCSGLMAANITTWNRVMDLYLQKHEGIFLKFLACSENPYIIINYLHIIASHNLTIEIDRDLAFTSIVSKHASKDFVLDYILKNFEQIKSKVISTHIILRNLISNMYSYRQLDKIKKFVKYYPKEQLEISYDKIQHLTNLRLNEIKNIKEEFWSFSFINKNHI